MKQKKKKHFMSLIEISFDDTRPQSCCRFHSIERKWQQFVPNKFVLFYFSAATGAVLTKENFLRIDEVTISGKTKKERYLQMCFYSGLKMFNIEWVRIMRE